MPILFTTGGNSKYVLPQLKYKVLLRALVFKGLEGNL